MKFLNKAITINGVEVKNRLVMPPMATYKTSDGKINDKILGYYNEKSRGGYIGLIFTEHSYVNRQGMANAGQTSLSEDSDIEEFRKLADTIHANGTKTFAQISHAGSIASTKATGMAAVSASSTLINSPLVKDMEIPQEMTIEQIKQTVEDFAEAARRVKEAGFDGVEIHSAHAYLLNQFYSPLTNKRTDEYGSTTLENRLRIHKEIIQAIREKVGPDFPIAVRLGACDYVEGGATMEDGVNASILLESYGADLLDISGGMNGLKVPGNPGAGYFQEIAGQIKSKVTVPVILTGGVTEAEEAEKLLETGKADMIGVGRAILKDSLWAKRAME